MDAASQPVAFSGDLQVAQGPAFFGGYIVRETGSAAAVVRFHASQDASGPLIGQATLGANGEKESVYPKLIHCPNGVFVDVVSGAAAGVALLG